MRSCSVLATARGCSWISLSMKCRYWPFSAASADISLSRTGRSTTLPSCIDDVHAERDDLGDVAFLQEHEAARHRQQRDHVRGDEVLVRAEAEHHRAARARGDERSGSLWSMTASA